MNGEVLKQENKSKCGKLPKNKRKVITLEQKLEVLKMYEKKIRTRDIVRLTGFNEATLRCIRNNADNIKKSYADSTPLGVKRTSKRRPEIMQMMEKQLVSWISDEVEKNSHVNILAIKSKALSLYEDLKKDYPAEASKLVFTASSGWFNRFKLREQIQNINVCGDYSTLSLDSFCSQLKCEYDDDDEQEILLSSNLNSFNSSQNSPEVNEILIQEHIEVHPEIFENQEQLDTSKNYLTKDILQKNLGQIEGALSELQRCDSSFKRSATISEEIKRILKPYYDLLEEQLENQISEEAEVPNHLPSISHDSSSRTNNVQQTVSETEDDSKEMILPI